MADFLLKAAISTLKTTIQGEVIKNIAPVIQENLTKIDELKPKIDEKLGELSKTIKTLIPDLLKEKVDVTMVIDMVNSIDSSVFKTEFEKIIDNLTKEQVTAAGSSKEELKTKIGGLPDDIKEMFIRHINEAFSTGAKDAAADKAPDAKDAAADKAPDAKDAAADAKAPAAADAKATGPEATADKDLKITSEEAANILNDLKKTLGPNVFDALIAAAGDIKAQQGSKGVSEANGDKAGPEGDKAGPEGVKTSAKVDKAGESEGVKTVVPNGDEAGESNGDKAGESEGVKTVVPNGVETDDEAGAKGGAKKRRRKTKKNIRRPKKSYTKFGRKF